MPRHLRQTLTCDQGKEMALRAEITATLEMTSIYFCVPHSPWQRPTSEHTSGLLRACFRKGTNLSIHTADEIAHVQAELNGRPRRILGWDGAVPLSLVGQGVE